MHICNSRIIVIIIIMTILSKHTITSHQRPAGDTPLKWHIAGGPLVARRSMAYRWRAVCGPTMCSSWVESGQSMGPIANICNYINYRMVSHLILTFASKVIPVIQNLRCHLKTTAIQGFCVL